MCSSGFTVPACRVREELLGIETRMAGMEKMWALKRV